MSSDAHEAPAPYGVRLVVAYDGSDFCGFQTQPGQRSVQGALERAIAAMAGADVRVRGAGRTDAGVHALGQVVAFDCTRPIPARGWMLGLNRHLPEDIRVQGAALCAPGYQPRFDALSKRYRYVIQQGEAKDPLLRRRAFQLGKAQPLDLARMREAAQLLAGTHDYRAFRAADDARANAVRTLHAITLRERFAEDPSLLAIEVHGTAFMKQMVRILSGTLVDVGLGRIPLTRIPALLGEQAERKHAGQTAPAHGLTLVSIELGRASAQGR